MKVCTKCKKSLHLDCFYYHKQSKDGRKSWCKKCCKDDTAKWRIQNRDRHIEYQRLYYMSHTIEYSVWHKNYRIANLNRLQESARQRYRNNPIPYKIRSAQRRGREIGSISKVEWEAILSLYEYKCAYCNSNDGVLEIEHIIPVSLGGRTEINNMVPSCRSCNRKKGGKHPICISWAWKAVWGKLYGGMRYL